MAQFGLHWSEWQKDPNIMPSRSSGHINRPRISSETIIKLLTLKSNLLGTRLNILKEAEEFEAKNA